MRINHLYKICNSHNIECASEKFYSYYFHVILRSWSCVNPDQIIYKNCFSTWNSSDECNIVNLFSSYFASILALACPCIPVCTFLPLCPSFHLSPFPPLSLSFSPSFTLTISPSISPSPFPSLPPLPLLSLSLSPSFSLSLSLSSTLLLSLSTSLSLTSSHYCHNEVLLQFWSSLVTIHYTNMQREEIRPNLHKYCYIHQLEISRQRMRMVANLTILGKRSHTNHWMYMYDGSVNEIHITK